MIFGYVYSAFETGEFKELYANKGVLIYKRFDELSELMIAINISKNQIELNFEGELTNLVTNNKYINKIIFEPNSYGVFVKKT